MSDETQAARVDESPRLDEDLIGYAIWPVGIALGFAGWSRGWSFSSVSFILFQWTIVPVCCVGFAKMLRGKASINSNLAVFLWEKTKLYFTLMAAALVLYFRQGRPDIQSSGFQRIVELFTYGDIVGSMIMISGKLSTLNQFDLRRRLYMFGLCAIVISFQILLISGVVIWFLISHPNGVY